MATKAKKKPAKKAPAKRSRPAKKPMTAKPVSARARKLITPLDDRILVRFETASETTAGGIYIPGTVAERPNRGQVIASGRGHRGKKGVLRPLDVAVGDTILFPQFAGTKIDIDGEELLILREEDVLGIVT
ncbi:MAG TPA: co-chaperone GroES [Bdellovibrionales bacterium]|nr:co-chaperone GroES [Bdellovibrionales bacterium]